MLIKVRNKLPGYLDLSPLKNHAGAPLILHGRTTYELLESDLQHPIVQGVMRAGWLEVVPDVAVARAPVAPPPPAPTPELPTFVETFVAEIIPEPVLEPLKKTKKKMPVVRQAASAEELRMPDLPEEPGDK